MRNRAVLLPVLLPVLVPVFVGAAAVTGLAALTACSGSAEQAVQTRQRTAAEQLTAARAKADAATSIHLTVRSSGIPSSADGVLGVEGSGTHAPAFKGTMDARIAGFQVKVDMVAVDKVLYLKLPFTTGFSPADPKEYNAPDPATLFAREGGITSLIADTVNPVEGESTRAGSEVLKTIKGTLKGEGVAKLLNIGDRAKTYSITYGITDPGGELRTVTVVGPFFAGATSTYTLTMDKYGDPVEITKP